MMASSPPPRRDVRIEADREEEEEEDGSTASSALRKTYYTEMAPRPARRSYPPISSIPPTPSGRLARAHPAQHAHPLDQATVLPSTASGAPVTSPDEGESTVLYLAYGSNLCAQTFLGMRGIRPLSQVNVTAPSLTLTFDVPGLPYREPCFANTAPRVPKKHSLPGSPTSASDMPDIPGAPTLPPALIGVVYEVTPADYAKIVSTEGGGASYAQIIVPCLPLPPPSAAIPEKPKLPPSEPPKPFLARTLCRPRIPDAQRPRAPSRWWWWWSRLLRPTPIQRPSPTYAQPSRRYLSLLRAGAREHDLPPAYRSRLDGLQPYTATTRRQRAGRFLLFLLWGPLLYLVLGLTRVLADSQTGRAPRWVVLLMTLLFNAVWGSYDWVFKPVFGDGERTEGTGDGDGDAMVAGSFRTLEGRGDEDEDEDEEGRDGGKEGGEEDEDGTPAKHRGSRRRSSVARTLRKLSGTTKIIDEEKKALLSAAYSDSD